jgi:hypothetical protein
LKDPLSRREGIVNPLPVLACVHEADSPKVRKVPGRRRLREVKNVDDVTYAEFACFQKAKNPQTCAVSEGTKELLYCTPGRRGCGCHIR